MSFLIRRNFPVAWAGWVDDFNRPAENPIQPPWLHVGDGPVTQVNDVQEMLMGGNFTSTNGGGPSFEFQPFTPNYGIEWNMWWPVEGLAAQAFNVMLTDTWAKKSAQFVNMTMIRLIHAPAVGGHTFQVMEAPNAWAVGGIKASFPSPVAYGGEITVKVWVEADHWVRVWANGIYAGQGHISDSYRTGKDRRAVRLFNNCLASAWVRWVDCYDRPSSIPTGTTWQTVLYDDFNRPDGAVGNGWTQIGTRGGITSNSFGRLPGDTTNESVGLIRDTGSVDGTVRVEATVGGHWPVSATSASGLVLRSNADGTEGMVANLTDGILRIRRFTSALNGDPPTYEDLADTQDVVLHPGDKVSFSAFNDIVWVEINGKLKLVTGHANYTHTYAGLRVERRNDSYSHSWDDVLVLKD